MTSYKKKLSTSFSSRNGRRIGLSCTRPARMASPASSSSTRQQPAGPARVAAAGAAATRKPGGWTRRSSACQSASPSCRQWRRPAPRTTWRPSAWRPTTRRTCLLLRTPSPWTGWRLCATLRSRYCKTFNSGLCTCVSWWAETQVRTATLSLSRLLPSCR